MTVCKLSSVTNSNGYYRCRKPNRKPAQCPFKRAKCQSGKIGHTGKCVDSPDSHRNAKTNSQSNWFSRKLKSLTMTKCCIM